MFASESLKMTRKAWEIKLPSLGPTSDLNRPKFHRYYLAALKVEADAVTHACGRPLWPNCRRHGRRIVSWSAKAADHAFVLA